MSFNLSKLIQILEDNGCSRVYIKSLAANDNSKNQIYFGSGYDAVNIFPSSRIYADHSGKQSKPIFKASLNFNWLNEEGTISVAPNAQFILYPQYPEVRFSGFLQNCAGSPSDLLRGREVGRLLFIGVNYHFKKMFGMVFSNTHPIVNEFSNFPSEVVTGVFRKITIRAGKSISDTRGELLEELKIIHEKQWIEGKKLNSDGSISECFKPQCIGFTLEAELGIIPNSQNAPDFLGWELKAFTTPKHEKISIAKSVTLFDPGPKIGFYKENGVLEFLKKYGYKDRKGRADRVNFGGIYRCGVENKLTKMTLRLEGYDKSTGKITDSEGYIGLFDHNDNLAAGWPFSYMLEKWTNKHENVAYVPALKEDGKNGKRRYYYGNLIRLGRGTSFQRFLGALSDGKVIYDPSPKGENMSTKPKVKSRNPFRIKSRDINSLYADNEIVDLHTI